MASVLKRKFWMEISIHTVKRPSEDKGRRQTSIKQGQMPQDETNNANNTFDFHFKEFILLYFHISYFFFCYF